ncbi:MAG: hypothetical protein HOH33_06215 [Verrucomicrobia bacterium]|nr:hypothetical protein [Verrucomicrobiota bacterium]
MGTAPPAEVVVKDMVPSGMRILPTSVPLR